MRWTSGFLEIMETSLADEVDIWFSGDWLNSYFFTAIQPFFLHFVDYTQFRSDILFRHSLKFLVPLLNFRKWIKFTAHHGNFSV